MFDLLWWCMCSPDWPVGWQLQALHCSKQHTNFTIVVADRWTITALQRHALLTSYCSN